ncbi:MAG TPA: hypothetical protein VHO25_03045 [Polyangiaceae bacterium]|nr:hypothetical protein [Polyangiaceae bacterium]
MSTGRGARIVAFWSGAVAWLSFAGLCLPARAAEPAAPDPTTVTTTAPASATAPSSETETARAADLYDEATRLYEAGEYAAASEKYLEADALVPSSEALSNAIVTARKADAPLLVARAAQRAIARELLDPALAERARVALNEIEPQLKQLEEHPQEAPATTEPARPREPAPAQKYSNASATPVVDSSRGVPPWVFWAGAGATGVLTGITVWSGLDTLHDKDTLPGRSDPNYSTATAEVDDSALRTDWLLTATLLTAASTAAVGIWAVDWHGTELQLGAAPLASGLTLRCWGQFQ